MNETISSNGTIKAILVCSVVVFLCCSFWLFRNIQFGQSTYSWSSIPASITNQERFETTHRDPDGTTRKRVNWRTTISYRVDGEVYSRVFPEKLFNPVTIFVDPNSPDRSVLEQGVTPGLYGPPLFTVLFAAAGVCVMVAIKLSPTD